MSTSLGIQPARPGDLATVVALLDDAAAWLQSRGIDQWPSSFSADATWRIDRIRAYVHQGMTYLAHDESGPVGTFTITEQADPEYAHGWPGGAENALYLFRMAVARSAKGRAIGARLLDWAGTEGRRRGKKWLRIDVHRSNPELQRYYEQQGFIKVAEILAPDPTVSGRIRGSGALMERPTG